jgi:hypothetical protein
MPGTRTWVFNAVHSWAVNSPPLDAVVNSLQPAGPLTSTERATEQPPDSELSSVTYTGDTNEQLFILYGGAGTGKSVISAKLIDYLEERGVTVGAVHFCRHDNPSASAGATLLVSLSVQLSESVDGYKERALANAANIEVALEKSQVDEIFESLIAGPLRGLPSSSSPVVLIIDALDELPASSLLPILGILSRQLSRLPAFVKTYVASREQPEITAALRQFRPLELRVTEQRNRQDVRAFFAHIAGLHLRVTMSTEDMEREVSRRWSGLEVSGKLQGLEEPLRRSKLCYDMASEEVREEREGLEEVLKITEVRPSPAPRQTSGDINVLFADAAEAREIVRSIFADGWEPMEVGDCSEITVEVPVSGTLKVDWLDNVIDPGLKSRARADEKVRVDYKGDASKLKDLMR